MERMVAKLEHRGPDAAGFWSSGPYSAGMRRLSIVDLAGGNQPLFDESGRVVLFYNGEIYNSPALRAELEREGFKFRTQSDGEVICHLYRKLGKKLFGRLDGMFAVALWDLDKQTLILARDYPGEKPLYFSKLDGGGVAFSSELPSLVASGVVPTRIDRQALWDFPTFLWVPEPNTIYESIKAVRPGHGWEISLSRMEEFSFEAEIHEPGLPTGTEEETISSVRTVVEEAVRSRLLSDVPMGAFLSGGLDSSIVCTVAKKNLAQLHTFSIGFENVEDPYHGTADESPLAEAYARKLGTIHSTIHVTEQEFRAALPDFIRAAGQPYAVSSGLGILTVAAAARARGIKVLLSGDGADEAFGGYSWYPSIPSAMRPGAPMAANEEVLRFLDRDGTLGQREARMASYPPPLRAWSWHYYASEKEKGALFHPDIKSASSLRHFAGPFQEPLDYLRHDRRFYFPYEMLTKLDRMTMACSVEGRAPFAAPALQKFAGRLKWNDLVRNGKLKWVLRRAFADVLPSEIVDRPKHGFNVPIDHWMKGSWADLLKDTFSPSSPLIREGILAPGSERRAQEILSDPRKVAGHVLFCFVMLHQWWNQK